MKDSLIETLRRYVALLFIFLVYFDKISIISLGITFTLGILAIAPQKIIDYLINILNGQGDYPSQILFTFVGIFVGIMILLLILVAFLCKNFLEASCEKNFLDLFLFRNPIKKDKVEDEREVGYEEIFINDKYIFNEEMKRIVAWMRNFNDTISEKFIYKVFIFYALRKNKLLVLLAFPEILFILITPSLSQHGLIFILFLVMYILILFFKLKKLEEDAIFIQSVIKYIYRGYILSDIIDMLRDIRKGEFRNIFDILRIILSN